MAGRLGNVSACSAEDKDVANRTRAEIETKAGRTFSTFDAVEVAHQVVAGKNYFLKIDVGGGDFIHARVYQDLKGNLSVHSVKSDKHNADPLDYF